MAWEEERIATVGNSVNAHDWFALGNKLFSLIH